MSYKTILVHVDLSAHCAQRTQVAARLAAAHDAHLVLAAMTGLSRFAMTGEELAQSDPVINSHRALLHQRATKALDSAEAVSRSAGASRIERRLMDDEAAAGITLQARYSDLVVLSQEDRNEAMMGGAENFPEFVLLNCGRPVLIVPYAGHFPAVGKRVLVAWNGSRESTRAVTAALPLLQQADKVEIAVINPDQDSDVHGPQPGADIALYLARHGVKAETMMESAVKDPGEGLLSLAADLSSDLLVMGAYGHSRFREILLGGVTRKLLSSMTLPVLFAH
ncbi:MAG: universal stress protein [Lacisediminimonas sp.]|nr:universal stress protein [Lacisediminimonas sp.]